MFAHRLRPRLTAPWRAVAEKARALGLIGVFLGLVPSAVSAQPQGEIRGRVVSDSGQLPVRDARVTVPRLGLEARSDSAGQFRLRGIRGGQYGIILTAPGFRPESVVVEVAPDEISVRDFVLHAQGTILPGQRIVGRENPALASRLVEFNERRQVGVGSFLDPDMLAKDADRGLRPGDVMAKVAGVTVYRGAGKAWLASGRAMPTCQHAFLPCSKVRTVDRADFAAGARPACYMDVYLDGSKVYSGADSIPTRPLFDVNTLELRSIAGIEVYRSAAQVPVKYNQSTGGCGVVLIWTR